MRHLFIDEPPNIVLSRMSPAVSAEAGAAAAAGVELEDCFLFLCALLVADSCLAEVNTLGPSSAAATPSEISAVCKCGNVCWLLYLYFSNVNFVQLESGKYHAEGGSTAAGAALHANHLHNCKILAILLPSWADLVLLHCTGPGYVTLVTVTTFGWQQVTTAGHFSVLSLRKAS